MIIPGALSQAIGIDPGRRGALALLSRLGAGSFHELVDMPLDPHTGGICFPLLIGTLRRWVRPGTVIMIEAGLTMPGRNSSGGTYLREQGQLVGVAQSVAFLEGAGKVHVEEAQPAAWKAVFGLHGQGKVGAVKYLLDKGLATGAELTPKGCRKPSDGRADALLIAMYAAVRGGWNALR